MGSTGRGGPDISIGAIEWLEVHCLSGSFADELRSANPKHAGMGPCSICPLDVHNAVPIPTYQSGLLGQSHRSFKGTSSLDLFFLSLPDYDAPPR